MNISEKLKRIYIYYRPVFLVLPTFVFFLIFFIIPVVSLFVIAFDKPMTVEIPSVSGTSVTSAMIQAVSTADEALELLYLMRQEILISEGRRMFDLGMRFPTNTDEIDLNPNINAGDPITKPVIPSYIPRDEAMNAYTWDEAGKVVTITHNMNKVIIQNKTSNTVCPFH